jgi:UDP:flavonoid glycosyltransferase YjiC (YdhE family)
LRAAVARVIDDPGYRAAAGRMAGRLAAERDDNLVVDELEHAAVGARGGGESFCSQDFRGL